MIEEYTHTVVVYTEPKKRLHFCSKKAAINYANIQLRKGVKVRIYPYSPQLSYADHLIERYNRGEINP